MTARSGLVAAAQTVGAATHSNTAFAVVFSIFVVAMVILVVVVVTWAIKRDRVGLAEWRRRRIEQGWRARGGQGPPSGNGRHPGGATGDAP